MVIRASAATQIHTLIDALASPSSTARDAAVARLTLIGARAVGRLCAVAASAGAAPDTRAAALRALEGIGDARAFEPALLASAAGELIVAAAGISTLQRLLRGPRETAAIDALTAIALDGGRSPRIRIAAARALTDLGPTALKPLWRRLRSDDDVKVRQWALSGATGGHRIGKRPASSATAATLDAMLEAGLPDDAVAVRRAIANEADDAPLTALHRLIGAIREREEASPRRAMEWATARAAAHATLAARGSRIALYDLRESLAAATTPLPVEFLAAVTTVGDGSCLEALAAAYTRSTRSGENWWRQHLRHAFHTIVLRERISRRHAVMKKVLARWPAIVQPGR